MRPSHSLPTRRLLYIFGSSQISHFAYSTCQQSKLVVFVVLMKAPVRWGWRGYVHSTQKGNYN